MTLALAVAGALAGAIIGSFLANLIVRWPRGEQVLVGRSHCDGCGRALRPIELIPIVSAISAKGRCRTCNAPIARIHIVVESAAAFLAATALLLHPDHNGVVLASFWLLLLAPALLDARHMWLPDPLTLILAISGLVLGWYVSGEPLSQRLIGGVTGAASLWLIAWGYMRLRGRSGMGAGDPKLFGAIGLWTGWQALPIITLLAALAGLSVAIAQRRSSTDRMPFGTLLIVGAILWTAAIAALDRPFP